MDDSLSALSLGELVSKLRDLHTTRTPLGWPTDKAVTKSSVERQLVERIIKHAPAPVAETSEQLSCDAAVTVKASDRPLRQVKSVTLQPGGLFLETEPNFYLDEMVELELVTDHDYSLKVRGHISFTTHGKGPTPAGIGVGFHRVAGDASDRRLERMVLELVRHRMD